MAKNRMDLTTGKPIRQILLFSLPLVLGSLFQQMYSFVDTIMVGRLISNDALAAVGSVSSLNFLVIGFVGGTCSGFAIPLAKSIGAKKMEDFRKYLWNGCWICMILAAGRVGNPLDIANMVLFLASDKAGFITGENICIDGGQTRLMVYHGDHGWTLTP